MRDIYFSPFILIKEVTKISEEIKIPLKEFINRFKGKNVVYYVDYKEIDGIIFVEKLRACHESYLEPKQNNMTVNQLANIVIEGFNQVNSRLDKVEQRLDKVEQRLDNLEKDVSILKEEMKEVKSEISTLKKDVALIKKCPTIKKELDDLN